MNNLSEINAKVKAYQELQAVVVSYIEELEQHVKMYNEELYLDLVDLKNDVWSDEILLQDAITKASSIFNSMTN